MSVFYWMIGWMWDHLYLSFPRLFRVVVKLSTVKDCYVGNF